MATKVLFVCLGNICRSPMAEGVFRRLVEDAGLKDKFVIDSAGTSSWHVGERAHSGTRRVLADHGISYSGRSRQIDRNDKGDGWDYVIAMDRRNLHQLQLYLADHPELHLLLDFSEQTSARDVPDPYYDGNFESVYALVEDGSKGLLAYIRQNENI